MNNNSYDVCLGENFYVESETPSGLFNIWNKESVGKVWKMGATISKRELQLKYPGENFDDLPETSKIILLAPNQSILGHTQEFIGGITLVTSRMFCRSSYGRCGLTVCRCAGLGDVGYYTRWTMEITNNNKYNAIPLVVGEPIAQIVFNRIGTEHVKESFTYSKRGHYQPETYFEDGKINIDRLVNSWCPKNMLPKLYQSKTWA